MTHRSVGAFVFSVTFLFLAGRAAGQSLPPWTPGTLDIHQISTGVGNSSLIIFPDGTTLLIDAGAAGGEDSVQHPDATRPAGEWIARYVRHALQHDASPAIDCAMITHRHGDHMGRITRNSQTGPHGYKIAGLSEVAEFIPTRRVLDRGWPDYDYPAPPAGPNGSFAIEEYRKFLNWQIENAGLRVDRFEAGRSDQITLVRDAARYPNFEVRNVVVNGEVWTGVGNSTRSHFPPIETLKPEDYPPENSCSAAIRITYGRFNFYAGGDLTGSPVGGSPAWEDVETEIAPVVGAVDVAVLDHHGMSDGTNETFLRTLQPRVILISTSNPQHPEFATVRRLISKRLYAGPRDIFATGVLPATLTVLGPYKDVFKSAQGHIVVRVEPGGNTYQVYVLDNSNESYAVKGVFGPYQAQ